MGLKRKMPRTWCWTTWRCASVCGQLRSRSRSFCSCSFDAKAKAAAASPKAVAAKAAAAKAVHMAVAAKGIKIAALEIVLADLVEDLVEDLVADLVATETLAADLDVVAHLHVPFRQSAHLRGVGEQVLLLHEVEMAQRQKNHAHCSLSLR